MSVKDARGCPATSSDTAHPYAPLSVVLSVTSIAQTCSENSDAATFLATAGGGNGVYTYNWSTVGSPSCSPGSGTTCTLDPSNDDLCADSMVMVSVSDTRGLCAPADAPSGGTYKKRTTVDATVP